MPPATTISPAALRVVKLLVGNRPLTVSELIETLGVTRTAVTEQLNELVAAGFVERTIEKLPGRGRPRHLYAATVAALLLLFANNQRLVVPAIWQSIADVAGEETLRKVVCRVTESIVEHYRPRINGNTPEERLRQMTSVLVEEGHLVEVAEDAQGRIALRKRSCPFISMYEENRTICGLDLDLISQVVGAPVQQTRCRHDGDPCCEFSIYNIEKASV